MAVINLQLDQCALATAQTTFGERMEMHDSESRESQCCLELHKQKEVI